MNWFKNLSISTKLMSSFMLITAVSILVGIRATRDMRELNDNGERMYQLMTVPMQTLENATVSLERVRIYYRDLAMAVTPEERAKYAGRIRESRAGFEKGMEDTRSTMIFPKGREALANLE